MTENTPNLKPFMNDYRLEQIDHETFRLRPNLEVKAAGLRGFIITKYNFTLDCSKFEIDLTKIEDFASHLVKLEYLLGDKECNVKKISLILDYLENNGDLINAVTYYLNNNLRK